MRLQHSLREEYFYRRSRMRAVLLKYTSRRWLLRFAYVFRSLTFGHLRHRLVWGILAAVTVAASSAGFRFASGYAHDRLVAQLITSAEKAAANRDYPRALSSLEWLTWLEPADQQLQLQLALAYERVGRQDAMQAVLASLAPDDEFVYPPAHLLKACRDVGEDDLSPHRLAAIEREIEWLGTKPVDRTKLDELKMHFWLHTGQLKCVEDLLNTSEQVSPRARLMAARTFASLGMRTPAVRQAILAGNELGRGLTIHEVADDRLLWAEAAGIVGDLASVEEILRTGSVLHPDGPFTLELARMLLQLSRQKNVHVRERENQLAAAMAMLERTTKSADVHFVLYELYRLEGDHERADRHLTEAVSQQPAHRLELARFQLSRGRVDEARSLAEEVRSDCSRQLLAAPHQRSARLQLAEAAVFLGDHDAAARILSEGLEQIADPAYSAALHRTHLAWWDFKTRGVRLSSDADLDVLEKAARYCPTSIELGRRLHDAHRIVPLENRVALERLEGIEQYVGSFRNL
jgi:tetratricopeptide (TPR) repeat protein